MLDLLGPQRVGERAQPELGGGVRRPVGAGRADRPTEFTNTTVPAAARRCGRNSRVSTAGAVRLTASCSSQACRRSRDTGPRSTTPATCTSESSGSVDLAAEAVERAGVGQVGDEVRRVRGRSARSCAARCSERASSTRSSPRSASAAGEDEPDARAGAGEDMGRHRVEDDLAEDVALRHRGEAVAGVGPSAGCGRSSGRVPVASSRLTSEASSPGCPWWSRSPAAAGRRSGSARRRRGWGRSSSR